MTVHAHTEQTQTCQKILLIEDHPIMRLGLIQLLNQEPDLAVCGEIGSGQEALTSVTTLQPSLVVVGLTLCGRDGLELLKLLHRHAPTIPLLVLSDYDETLYAVRALQAGARGYLPKWTAADALVRGIRQILRGDIAVSERLASQLVQTAVSGNSIESETPISGLTNRELEVLRYIGAGSTTREIAETLCISVKTVETYRSHLIKKLRLNHSRDLIRYAIHWFSNLNVYGRVPQNSF